MAEIIPFRGILYDTSKVSGEDITSPPYDIITPEIRERLYDRSPYNIVRIDSGMEMPGDNDAGNKYSRARGFLYEWLESGILRKTAEPFFYAYEVSYSVKGKPLKLRGFFALVRLEELASGNIYPHECTHSKPKHDRLSLMRACHANLSPIFAIYNSPMRTASGIVEAVMLEKEHYMQSTDNSGAMHKLWLIEDKADIARIQSDLAGSVIFIADGHHRYETALDYQREMRERHPDAKGDQPYDYVLMFLANMSDRGLTILPTHRLVRDIADEPLSLISQYFDIETTPEGSDICETIGGMDHAIGFYQEKNSRQYILKYKGNDLSDQPQALKDLDVVILHEIILKRLLKAKKIDYNMDMNGAIAAVRSGHYDAAFFLRPTRVEDVENVALGLQRMPPKSTYFYPKLLTGFIMSSL